MDYGFSGRISKDKDGNVIESSREDIEGINGKTSWLIISDGITRMLHGDYRLSKVSPIKYLESFLQQYAPACKDKWAVMDQGGELYQSTAVRSLFKKYGYEVLPTGADSSFQNGPIEQAHRTVATGIKSLLIGSGLDARFWPNAFTHVLCICNAIPGQGQVASPLFLVHWKER